MPRPLVSASRAALVGAFAALVLLAASACSVIFSVSDFASVPAADGGTTQDASPLDAHVDAQAAFDGPSYAEEVLADTPLVYLRFDDPADAGKPKNLGSLSLTGAAYAASGVTFGVSPGALAESPNAAIGLDGQGGNVLVGTNAELDFENFASYSLEIWMEADAAFFAQPSNPFERLFGKSAGSGDTRDGYASYIRKGPGFAVERFVNANIGRGSFGYIASDNAALENGAPVWFQVVVTFDGAQIVERLYVDGVNVAANASNVPLQGLAGAALVVGGEGDGGPGVAPTWFKGSLDEFSVYDHALTAERVAKHYQAAVRRAR